MAEMRISKKFILILYGMIFLSFFTILQIQVGQGAETASIGENLWVKSYRGDFFGTPASADLDNDGEIEMVFPEVTWVGSNFYMTCIYAKNGTIKWSQQMGGRMITPILADINNDEIFEIFTITRDFEKALCCMDGRNGNMNWKFFNITAKGMAFGDIDNDSTYELVIGNDTGILCINANTGVQKWLAPITPPRYITAIPLIADYNNDDKSEIFYGDLSKLYCFNSNGVKIWETNLYPCYAIAAADVDGNGLKELFVSSEGLISAVDAENGDVIWQYECPFPEMTVNFMTIGDVDGDGDFELYGGIDQISFVCLNAMTGKKEWDYKFEIGSIGRAPIICDFDGDGQLELITGGDGINGIFVLNGKGDLESHLDWQDSMVHWPNVEMVVCDGNQDGLLELYVCSAFTNNSALNQQAFIYCFGLNVDAYAHPPLWSSAYGSSLNWNNANDQDEDGLVDQLEIFIGLNPKLVDTDGDGLPDGWETNYNLNPFTADSDVDIDDDGRTNLQEFEKGTNPQKKDSDGDFIPDNLDFSPQNVFIPDAIFGILVILVLCCCCRKR